MSDVVGNAVLVLIPMVLSLTVHEFAHAWAARALGDDTAEREGRLNLNPLNHADPVGTILLPLMILLANGAGGGGMRVPFFGWARPVPTNPMNYRDNIPVRQGMMLVAIAGPLSNLILAFITAGVLVFGFHGQWYQDIPAPIQSLLQMLFGINIALFVFNMIPIYPLDGEKVVSYFLRGQAAVNFERFNMQYGSMALLCIVFFGHNIIGRPIAFVNDVVLQIVGGAASAVGF